MELWDLTCNWYIFGPTLVAIISFWFRTHNFFGKNDMFTPVHCKHVIFFLPGDPSKRKIEQRIFLYFYSYVWILPSKTTNKQNPRVVFMKSLGWGPFQITSAEVMARYSGTELLVMVGKSVLGAEGKMTAFMWWLLGWMWHSPWVPKG